jgi:hypothetical protein
MRPAKLFLFLVLLLPLSFAADIILPDFGIPILILIATISAFGIAGAYMAGSFLQSPQILAWSRQQIQQLLAGSFIVLLVWGAAMGTNTLVGAIFLQGGGGFASVGAHALDDHIGYLEALYLQVCDAYQAVGMFQGFGYFASVGGFWFYFGAGASPFFGVSGLLAPLSSAASSLTMQILTFRLLRVFTFYIDGVVPNFLLPIALGMRLLPFTQRAGNTMIAICLGAMFMLPLSFVFVNEFSSAVEWEYREDALDANFKFENMGADNGLVDFIMNFTEVMCKNAVIRNLLSLGEFVWSAIFAAVMAIPCLAGYGACFVSYFVLFWLEIWPNIATLIQIIIGAMVLAAFAIDAATVAGGHGGVAAMDKIATLLLPAVSEATGFSVISIIIIALITFTGTKAISAALGGEYVLYGISRFV